MMKRFLSLLLLINHNVFAQYQYLFSLAELKQLVICPDKSCFRKAVTAKGYEYYKTEQISSDGALYIYRVLSTGKQPYYAKHIISFLDWGNKGHSVHFLTTYSTYPSQLDADLTQQNYVLQGYNDPTQSRKYIQEVNGIEWQLDRYVPNFSKGLAVPTYKKLSENPVNIEKGIR